MRQTAERTFYLTSRSYLLFNLELLIVSNTNYEELLVLDSGLRRLTTIELPQMEGAIHDVYRNDVGDQVILVMDGYDDFLILLDAESLQCKVIRLAGLSSLYPAKPYAWKGRAFFALAGYGKFLMSINTERLILELRPASETPQVAPELATYLEVRDRFSAYRIPGTRYYLRIPDFELSSVVSVLDCKGREFRSISIEKELDSELKRLGGKLLQERFPYTVEYKEGWFLVIWERKVLVVSPLDIRTTLSPTERFRIFFGAKFIETHDNSAKIVVLTYDDSCVGKSELQLYHVGSEA